MTTNAIVRFIWKILIIIKLRILGRKKYENEKVFDFMLFEFCLPFKFDVKFGLSYIGV